MISTLVVGGGLKEKKEEVFRQPVAAFLQFKVAETSQNLVFPNLCSSGLQTHFIFYQFLIRRYHFLFASSKPICEIKQCLGGGFKYFCLFIPIPEEMESNLTSMLFKWIGSTTT